MISPVLKARVWDIMRVCVCPCALVFEYVFVCVRVFLRVVLRVWLFLRASSYLFVYRPSLFKMVRISWFWRYIDYISIPLYSKRADTNFFWCTHCIWHVCVFVRACVYIIYAWICVLCVRIGHLYTTVVGLYVLGAGPDI